MSTENENPTEEQTGEQEYTFTCPECHSGVMRLKYLTYFTWLNNELITVPNFPSWVCDMCGRREYDTRAVSWLNTLLSPSTGKRLSVQRKNRPPRIDRIQPDP